MRGLAFWLTTTTTRSSAILSLGGGRTRRFLGATREMATEVPRPAVSAVVQWRPPNRQKNDFDDDNNNTTSNTSAEPYYLLIQRGQPPNAGLWSLPGGKLEFGETACQGAQRELAEEVYIQLKDIDPSLSFPQQPLSDDDKIRTTSLPVAWHPHPFTSSDAIGDGYHYLIAQCFGQVVVNNNDDDDHSSAKTTAPPTVYAADDAQDAQWVTLSQIVALSAEGHVTPGVDRVVERAHTLWDAGWLPTTQQ